MVWFKVDDGWHKHRKRIRAGLDMEGMAAQGLWVAAGSWAGDELSDGFVPDDIVDYLAPGIGQRLAKRLERARLWIRSQRDDEEGWQFWQWEDQQPTAEEVTAALSKKSSGGKLGNHRRWHVREGKFDPDCPYCYDGNRSTDRSSDSVPNRSDIGSDGRGASASPSRRSGGPARNGQRADAGISGPNRPGTDGSRDDTSDRYSDRSQESVANRPTRPDPTRPKAGGVVHAVQPPSPRCEQHRDDPNPPRCGSCADHRRAREQWDRDQAAQAETARAEAAAQLAAERRAQAETRRAAIDACDLCDTAGYTNGHLCDHDPAAADRARRGAALARAQLAAKDVA